MSDINDLLETLGSGHDDLGDQWCWAEITAGHFNADYAYIIVDITFRTEEGLEYQHRFYQCTFGAYEPDDDSYRWLVKSSTQPDIGGLVDVSTAQDERAKHPVRYEKNTVSKYQPQYDLIDSEGLLFLSVGSEQSAKDILEKPEILEMMTSMSDQYPEIQPAIGKKFLVHLAKEDDGLKVDFCYPRSDTDNTVDMASAYLTDIRDSKAKGADNE